MKVALCLALLAPALASADEVAHPEDLTLGELGSLQEAMELQVSVMPSQTREGWQQGMTVEYGVTRWLQVAVGGTWNHDDERALELAALVAPIAGEHVSLALGAEAATDGEVTPMASLLVGGRHWGVNLAVASSIDGEVEVAAALFARLSRWKPIVEAGAGEESAWRAGLAVQLGAFELLAAGGHGSETGAAVNVIASWAIGLGDDDADDDADDDRRTASR